MDYKTWFEEHAKKHNSIVIKLVAQGLDKEEIVEYFRFENMLEKEMDFCPLYAQNKKCHEMEYLNCYFCACPHFRFNDKGIATLQGKVQYSLCAIESKAGTQGIYGEAIHQDCSTCKIPHTKQYILKNFQYDWKKSMKNCILEENKFEK